MVRVCCNSGLRGNWWYKCPFHWRCRAGLVEMSPARRRRGGEGFLTDADGYIRGVYDMYIYMSYGQGLLKLRLMGKLMVQMSLSLAL